MIERLLLTKSMSLNVKDLIEKKAELTGEDYFQYQAIAVKQSQAAADEWLLGKAFGLTPLQANTELTFQDRVALDKDINKVVEGYEVTQAQLSGAYYSSFKSKLQRDPTEAVKWLSSQLFLVNGNPMKELKWSEIPYGVTNSMIVEASSFF